MVDGPVHTGFPHTVVATAKRRHCPSSAQKPSAPQGSAWSFGQALFGSVSTLTLSHLPCCPPWVFAPRQLWQSPEQAALQQTPSTQKLD
jgi:hypothetical protein